jgi:hypothetical protein
MAMKAKTLLLVVAANLAVLVLLALGAPHLMISPGKTLKAHEEFSDDCFACHAPFIGSTSQKCIACHEVEEIGLRTTKGVAIDKEGKNVAFHQQLVEKDCVSCHSDHKGVKSFRPISRFSHHLLASDLREQCDSCHSNPGDSLHSKNKENCSQCHQIGAWSPAKFEHDKYFLFDRVHYAQCETCHPNNDFGNYTCYGCHEHSRSNIRGEHLEEGIWKYENCVECHRSGDEHEAEWRWRSRGYERGEGANRYRRGDDDDEGEHSRYRFRRHDDD